MRTHGMMTETQPGRASQRMTYDEWLSWQHSGITEWINGDVIQMPTSDDYQRI